MPGTLGSVQLHAGVDDAVAKELVIEGLDAIEEGHDVLDLVVDFLALGSLEFEDGLVLDASEGYGFFPVE